MKARSVSSVSIFTSLRCLGSSVLVALSASSCASPPGEPPPADLAWLDGAGAFDLGGSALVIHSAGAEEILSDPRDEGLRRALALLDERLLDLHRDRADTTVPEGMIEFLCEALCAPWTLRVDVDAPGLIPIHAEWTVQAGSSERASALAARFAALIEHFALPSAPARGEPSLSEVALPIGSLFHGTTGDGSSFVLAWGEPEGEALDLAGAGLPAGVRPSFAFGIDYGALMDAARSMTTGDDPEREEIEKLLAGIGLGIAAARRSTAACGYDAGGLHLVSRDAGWVPMAEKIGVLAAGPIPESAMGLVPDDAMLVSVSRLEPAALLKVIALLGEEGAGALEKVRSALGIELGPDLLEPLGQTFGFYLSGTTGGNDLTSAVGFAAVDDAARLATTLDALAAKLNSFGESEGEGRVRARPFERGGARGFELVFPGLPVPIRPTLALHGGFLMAAASPQALSAALDWAGAATPRGDATIDGSWRTHFAPALVGPLDDVQSLFYLDTPRLARQGFGLASLLAAAAANGLLSPSDPSRDAGLVIPPLPELLQGSRPVVLLARTRGQDLVTAGTMDRSASSLFAAMMGFAPSLASGALLAGTLGALGREDADEVGDPRVTAAENDIWSILEALDGHASEHDGRYPGSLEALLEPDEEGLSWLAEIPVDPWGHPYVYELDGEKVRVLSYGADGVPGGEGADADVSSDDLGYFEDEEGADGEGWMDLDEPEEDPDEPKDDGRAR